MYTKSPNQSFSLHFAALQINNIQLSLLRSGLTSARKSRRN